MTNILDTVEPDAWMCKELDIVGGLIVGFAIEKVDLPEEAIPGTTEDYPLYSRETVESLLEAHRKQVLLEAAEVSRDAMHTTTRDGYNLACSDIRDELRRMAEGEK